MFLPDTDRNRFFKGWDINRREASGQEKIPIQRVDWGSGAGTNSSFPKSVLRPKRPEVVNLNRPVTWRLPLFSETFLPVFGVPLERIVQVLRIKRIIECFEIAAKCYKML